jgi:arsenate reductase
MNVLFVCTHNVGRSQMAATLYNSLSADGHADAAGTKVDQDGETLGELAKNSPAALEVLTVMHELGFDLWHRKRHQLTKKMLSDYDLIVVMADVNTIPKYLHNHPKAVYWEVADPRLKGVDATRETRDELKRHVVSLLESTR